MKPLAISFLSLSIFCSVTYGQVESEFLELLQSVERKIDNSLAEYQAFLEKTGTERLELVTQVNQLENTLVKLRNQERNAQQIAQKQQLDLEALNDRISQLDTQAQYSEGVLSEYLTNFDSRIHISEDQKYMAKLREIRSRLEEAGDNPDERIPQFFAALESGLERQESLLGGLRFEGKAITPEGGIKEGEIALFGPVAYFNANDSSASGILKFNSGTIEPGLALLPELQAKKIQAFFQSGSGELPFDASLGNALVLKKARGTIIEHVQKGGWVGYAIIALGGLAIITALVKLIELATSKLGDAGDIREIAKSAADNDIEGAKAKAQGAKGPIAAMLVTGIDFIRADSETIYESMEAVIMRYRPKLERFLPFLATTAAIAPLMGLLGTVVGMIKTFTLIEVFGTGDAKSLSSGISEALVTTELGLIVAIPALIFHGIFTRIMRGRIGILEQVAIDFSRHLSVEKDQAE